MKQERRRSDIAWSDSETIRVRGFDLCNDIIGKVNLGDMAFIELRGRLPTTAESTMLNAILVTLVEHGLTPSALAARLTYLGAPESLQGVVAAGLLGLGSRFVGTIEGAARLLQEHLPPSDDQLSDAARTIVGEHRSRHAQIPGLGHPVHKQGDPRSLALIAVAEQNGFMGRYVEFERRIATEASAAFKRDLPINATGAIAAIASEMGFPWSVMRGFAIMSRAVGLVAHALEEQERPLAMDLWNWAEEPQSPSQGNS